MSNIENLLQQVSIIQKKYDEIAKITGENFNIFSVMNMETDEVKTHSAIIGELLNPQGSHGQGSVFLDLFIDHLKNKFNKNEEILKLNKFGKLVSEKICERTISISNNWVDVTGGRIDIIIEDEKQIFIIETKINAEDQDYQLIRYNNYAKGRNKLFYIFYLTIDGKSLSNEKEYSKNKYLEVGPSEDISVEGYNFHYEKKNEYKQHKTENVGKPNIHQCLYYPISFSDEIKEWLIKCIEKTVSLPVIRETLVQYLFLIKKITNQTTNNKMNKEIIKTILSSENNIKSAVEINKIDVKQIICDEFLKKIILNFDNEVKTKNYNNVLPFGKYGSGIWFYKEKEEKENFKIGVLLWFDKNLKLQLGIDVNSDDSEIRQSIRKINKSKTDWIKIISIDENYNNLEWEELLLQTNIDEIAGKIKELIEEVNNFKTH